MMVMYPQVNILLMNIKKRAEDFVRLIVDEDDWDTMYALELTLLEEENVVNNEAFYNQSNGGSTGFGFKGRKHSSESKKRMSLARKNQVITNAFKKRVSEGKQSKPLSETHRKNMSIAAKMRKRPPHSEETKEKMQQAAIKRHIKRLDLITITHITKL